MEYKDEKLEMLTGKLRQTRPVLSTQDATLLTERIMRQIDRKPARTQLPIVLGLRTILSSAAVLLLGLLVFQQTEAKNIVASDGPVPALENKRTIDLRCVQLTDNEHHNLMKTYFCYMQQKTIENNQFKSLYSTINPLRP
jgi:hypothetical protein